MEKKIGYDGLITFWTLGQWSRRNELEDSLSALGFVGVVPQHRTHNACLRDAMVDVMETATQIIRPLKLKDGYSVTLEDRGVTENHFSHLMSARIDSATNVITFDGRLPDIERQILERYNAHLGLLPNHQVAAALVNVMAQLGGVALRPRGGVYWLAGKNSDRWKEVGYAVEKCSANGKSNEIFRFHHDIGPDEVLAITAAIAHEVESQVKEIEDELTAGNLKAKALENRQNQSFSLKKKVEQYEGILSGSLGGLHEMLERVTLSAGKAIMMLEREELCGQTA